MNSVIYHFLSVLILYFASNITKWKQIKKVFFLSYLLYPLFFELFFPILADKSFVFATFIRPKQKTIDFTLKTNIKYVTIDIMKLHFSKKWLTERIYRL